MNNRLGAVCSALYSFWTARQATVGCQRDANTVILHAQNAEFVCGSDTTRSPGELLDLLLRKRPKGGNDFNKALQAANLAISKGWDDARPPVIIFLSDGIASVSPRFVRNLFCTAAGKGYVALRQIFNGQAHVLYSKGLSMHAILFGPKKTSTRMEQMIAVARDAQSTTTALACAPSSFHEAIDSVGCFTDSKLTLCSIHLCPQVQLSQTFLGIAESLRKPRGALMQ